MELPRVVGDRRYSALLREPQAGEWGRGGLADQGAARVPIGGRGGLFQDHRAAASAEAAIQVKLR